MQLISEAMVNGSLEFLAAREKEAAEKSPPGADFAGNRQQRRAAAALERKQAKREGRAACAR